MMATTIRVNEDDLKRFNAFIGARQARSGENISQANGFEMLLNRHEGFEENDDILGRLLEYVYPIQADDQWDNGFNVGFEAGLYMAMGAVTDAADSIGKEDFTQWLESIEDETLKKWITERYEPYDSGYEQNND